MRRITGAAALGYVVLAAIENMSLLGLPGLGAPASEVRAAYADTALGVVTVSAGALSLACYLVFAAGLQRLLPAVAAVALAGAGLVAAALLVGGGDPALFDVQLTLRYLAGPLMALVVIRRAPPVAAALALTPLALAGYELLAQLAFAASAAWIWWVGMRLSVRSVREGAFLMLVVAAGLVGIALLIVPGATGTFFAWGLAPAPLAAFAGGVYVGSAIVYAAGLRADDAQPLVVAAAVLSVSVLAATILHLEVFDFSRLQAWAWVGLFAAFGAITTFLSVRGAEARGPRVPTWARAGFGVAAIALGAAGLALWIDPAAFSLPPLGGRFAGSWAAMLATLAAWPAIRGTDGRLPALALVALPLGALAGIAATG